MRRALLVIPCILLAAAASTWAADATITIDEVRPGDRGVLRTVFEGTKVEEVPVEVVDVIRNVSPERNVVIIRLSGDLIEKTGVARGMSGSPVYIKGRLLGALAFAWPMLREPVAGVTPIAEMTRVKPADAPKAVAWNAVTWDPRESIPSPGFLSQVLSPRPLSPVVNAVNMRVLRTPVVVSGLGAAGVDRLAESLRAFDVSVVQAGGGGKLDAKDAPAKLVPGGTLCVSLMRGDIDASAIGTVTEVDGQDVYGFGHPLMGAGAVAFPMSGGRVHMTVPSNDISFKLGSAGPPVGTLRLDHSAGIAGRLGEVPAMMSVKFDVTRQDVAHDSHFDFEVVRDPRVTLSLLNAALSGALVVSGRPDTQVKMIARATIEVEGYAPIEVKETFGGPQAPIGVAGILVQPLGHILHNPYEEVTIKSIRVSAEVTPGDPRALIRYAETDRYDYLPGETVDVAVTLQPWRGKLVLKHCKLKLPDDLPEGDLALIVCDTATDTRMESGEMPHRFRPQNVEGILDFFRHERPTTDLVFRMSRATAGIALDGRELPELPASVVSVLDKQPPTETSRFAEVIVRREPTDFVIVGSQRLKIHVKKK